MKSIEQLAPMANAKDESGGGEKAVLQVQLDRNLLHAFKVVAVGQHTTMSAMVKAFIERVVAERITQDKKKPHAK